MRSLDAARSGGLCNACAGHPDDTQTASILAAAVSGTRLAASCSLSNERRIAMTERIAPSPYPDEEELGQPRPAQENEEERREPDEHDDDIDEHVRLP
jgi:hypothetical protein